MAGTDHAQGRDWHGPQPVFVLVRPQMGENIGAAARAMWNFGLEHMRIVDPRDGWPNPAASATASGAARVLDQVRIDATTAQSVADLTHVYATTARPRELTKPVLSPQEAMEDARARIAAGERVGVMFGPERAGLENADVVLANTIITVPVNPAFASLNLAQCALLVAYEWGREVLPVARPEQKHRPANRVEVTRLLEALEARLDRADFYRPEHKREHMRTTLHNMFYRLDLTEADIRILHGIHRALADRHPTRE
ncbi:RNA methyltransferase [Halovulum dunhuangense]|uniref:RNA methyltransferase n=1 Tax=Halovulum dunhuangense TaxID=1505036 RepID=A0A849L2T1_9RHOB|nr:TrmH family RNA methyltransferase [Halovulum dunhuangense]NNU80595.1 RNA methyltransferase [Halovulum dunhuangense]